MPRPSINLAAGHRRLGARRAARQLEHQVEAAALADAVQRDLREAVRMIVEAYGKAGFAKDELVEANRIACSAEYEAPAQISAVSA